MSKNQFTAPLEVGQIEALNSLMQVEAVICHSRGGGNPVSGRMSVKLLDARLRGHDVTGATECLLERLCASNTLDIIAQSDRRNAC